MLTYTYIREGKFGLVEKPKLTIQHERDAIIKVTLASICSSASSARRASSTPAPTRSSQVLERCTFVTSDSRRTSTSTAMEQLIS